MVEPLSTGSTEYLVRFLAENNFQFFVKRDSLVDFLSASNIDMVYTYVQRSLNKDVISIVPSTHKTYITIGQYCV